jgi:hypothetical protein
VRDNRGSRSLWISKIVLIGYYPPLRRA